MRRPYRNFSTSSTRTRIGYEYPMEHNLGSIWWSDDCCGVCHIECCDDAHDNWHPIRHTDHQVGTGSPMAFRHRHNERRMAIRMSGWNHERNLVVCGRFSDRPHPLGMGAHFLHHDSRDPIRYATLQTDEVSPLPLRQNRKLTLPTVSNIALINTEILSYDSKIL